MRGIFENLVTNWPVIVIPAAVFIVSLIATFWLRKRLLDYLQLRTKRMKWLQDISFISAIRGPLAIFCLILSLYLGLAVSMLPAAWKHPIGNGLWTLFIVALTITLLNISQSLIDYSSDGKKLPPRATLIARSVARIMILGLAVLLILDLWGVPVTALMLFIAIIILAALLAYRDSIPNLLAGFQIAATQEIKVGDFIKLESKEEGYVTSLNWNTTQLKNLEGGVISVPNTLLVRHKVINYGRPIKKATEPFIFNTRAHLAELTGLKARNLKELLIVLETASESMIYYHTHHALEENQYFHPELSNDFSNWVENALDDHVLAEKLANLSSFEFTSLLTFRDRVVEIIKEYIAKKPSLRDAPEGQEFYVMRSVSVILPTTYAASDLREFIEALRKVSPSSLYYHIFESRLRLGNQLNDFSAWLKNNLDEEDLSQEIGRIDPYTYTLEGLRSLLIQIIEKRIK